jgi:hypothetical protein
VALRQGGTVTVEGVVTIGPTLIDPSGRLLIIQDATAAIEVRLPVVGSAGAAGLAGHSLVPGAQLQVSGAVGRSYGAPRLSASSATWLGSASQPLPLPVTAAPGPALEWRLVRATGRFDAVHRLGVRWRAELIIGSARIPVVGLTGSQIAVGRLHEGRRATIVGIVRRAYPSASDQRFAIDPRSVSDLSFGLADPVRPGPTRRPAGPAGGASTGTASAPTAAVDGAFGGAPAPSGELGVDLRDLASRRGQLVRVGGLVTRVDGAVISLDDGTATGRLILTGHAAPYLDLVEVGDALEATGLVESDTGGPYLLVTDPDGVAQAGDLDAGTLAAAGASAAAGPSAGPTGQPEASVNRLVDAGSTIGEPAGSGLTSLLQALGLALLGAIVALAIALPMVQRNARAARQAGPDDGPHARPTLGPS